MGSPPPNAYRPGTQITVGSHKVAIQKYISEGGFAHVYLVDISPPYGGSSVACLKRVAVPDKPTLNILRAEVDAMKRLKGHRHIVLYIDSHAARMPGSTSNVHGYEVFLLMEYCSRNGLIDFMNTRLTHKLTEPEILMIMAEITEGVANCHALQPPLIHRDIKIENVLVNGDGRYKLCDFGSAAPALRPPKNVEEFQVLQDDIMRHTTAQYRSPEMVDLYRGFPIDEKADIWALGVFLYKLCYYTTPFETSGERAILHARFQFPHQPQFSDRLKNVISACLREDPRKRPNAYQLLEEVCKMRGLGVPIRDYTQVQVPPKPRTNASAPDLTRPATPPKSAKVVPKPKPDFLGLKASAKVKLQDIQMVSHDLSSDSSGSSLGSLSPHHKDAARESLRVEQLSRSFKHVSLSTPSSSTNLKDISIKSKNISGFSKPKETSSLGKSEKLKYDGGVSQRSKPSTELLSRLLPRTRASVELQRARNSPRPVSMHGDLSDSTEDHKSLKEIIHKLSSDSDTYRPDEHIDDNLEFLRTLEKQDSGRSWRLQKTGESIRRISTGSKNGWKRSSISGIKSLLTGDKKGKSQPSSRNVSVAQEPARKSSETGYPARHSMDAYRESEVSVKRSSSIQRRVQELLGRKSEPAVKTATGYGKYTEQEKVKGPAVQKKSPEGTFKVPDKVAVPEKRALKVIAKVSVKVSPPHPVLAATKNSQRVIFPQKAEPSLGNMVPKLPTILRTSPTLSKVSTPTQITTAQSFVSKTAKPSPSTSKLGPPSKPKKPEYLKSPATKIGRPVKEEDDSDFDSLFPDIDLLTQSFKQRYPSAV
ncbi:hypothetical protein BABINDRAFT_159938 [Babjeviella inositovora NRRL Y-12698]|uniref:non-specific serine/threonine protein kinase n=1 Tax=Babjeviella inositovora NRRL Y-12698 TaxID=984486 RepID=A0A1E3QVJ4_9ASCO|nr:uncharacterized protein BABINDRAFT_159938 [Babjeviella inositovora NRRL Y-12698]ODQ81680.1 hypothetical protein BABINDRAFT_159938 [Babjeviella inositovora NRRL Y-12698]